MFSVESVGMVTTLTKMPCAIDPSVEPKKVNLTENHHLVTIEGVRIPRSIR
jgi:hypothetical protein